jgi:4-hydroxybenzoate polyprenyltransferase
MISALRLVAHQLRVYQWVKNLLLILPIVLAHRINDSTSWFHVAVAFLCFSLCASAVYTVNDIVDIEADRRHHRKQFRPIASGRLSVTTGVGLAIACTLVAAVLAVQLSHVFVQWLVLYVVTTTAYTFVLKKVVIVDVLVLAGLYSIRVVAGGAAADVVVSPWLLMMTLFVSTSLAFVKRFTELNAMPLDDATVMRRGYQREDMDLIRVVGPAIGLLSVVVLTLYIAGDDVQRLYRTPQWLWLCVPIIMFWVIDIWRQALRGLVHDDPIIHVARDVRGWIVAVLLGVIAALAT